MMDHVSLAAALFAALETKLLAALIEMPRTPAEHARSLGLDVRATERVLDVLVAYGLAARDADAVGPSDELVGFLEAVPGGETMLAMWAHTPTFLRTGKPFLRMDGADKARYATVAATLGNMMEVAAGELAAKLVPAAPQHILDVGCGSGVWSLAIAARQPAAHVTGVDRAEVLDAFRARARELGLSDRIASIAGDIESAAVAREFDLVIVANVLRLYEPNHARRILGRAAAAVAPGGALVVVDALAAGTPDRERARASYALHLAMRTEQGQVYAPETVTAWMTAAGIADCRAEPLSFGPGAVGALVGRAPR